MSCYRRHRVCLDISIHIFSVFVKSEIKGFQKNPFAGRSRYRRRSPGEWEMRKAVNQCSGQAFSTMTDTPSGITAIRALAPHIFRAESRRLPPTIPGRCINPQLFKHLPMPCNVIFTQNFSFIKACTAWRSTRQKAISIDLGSGRSGYALLPVLREITVFGRVLWVCRRNSFLRRSGLLLSRPLPSAPRGKRLRPLLGRFHSASTLYRKA